jgi:hypothetical protein
MPHYTIPKDAFPEYPSGWMRRKPEGIPHDLVGPWTDGQSNGTLQF